MQRLSVVERRCGDVADGGGGGIEVKKKKTRREREEEMEEKTRVACLYIPWPRLRKGATATRIERTARRGEAVRRAKGSTDNSVRSVRPVLDVNNWNTITRRSPEHPRRDSSAVYRSSW